MEQRLINASSGGSLGDMTLTEIQELIEKLAIESKHSRNKDEWYSDHPRGVKEFSNAHLESQIYEPTKVIILLKKEKAVLKKQWGICLKTKHPTYMCLLLQEDVVPIKDVEGLLAKTTISTSSRFSTTVELSTKILESSSGKLSKSKFSEPGIESAS